MKGFIQVKRLFNANIAKNALHSPMIYIDMKELIQVKYLLNVWTVANDSNNQTASQSTKQFTVMKEQLNVRYVKKDSKLLALCINIRKHTKPYKKTYFHEIDTNLLYLYLFSNSMDNSNIKGSEQSRLEKYFRHSIQMVLQDKMSWSTLTFLLVDMAQTVVDCKQLIKVLLKELEISYKEKQVVNDDLKTYLFF